MNITLKNSPSKTRWYVGLDAKSGYTRQAFSTATFPRCEDYPEYGAVIGPFRTKRGALFCARYGFGNPHIRSVADVERIAKAYAANPTAD